MATDVFPSSNTGTLVVGSFGTSQTMGVEGVRPTYSYASITNTPAATPTDILTLTPTNTVCRISRVEIGGQATTAGVLPIRIGLRSSADLTGTSTAPAGVAHNANDAAATAGLKLYTVNPGTLGTLVGYIRQAQVFLNVATAAADRMVWTFGQNNEKAIFVPVGYTFFVNGVAATVPAGGTVDISITWEEGP